MNSCCIVVSCFCYWSLNNWLSHDQPPTLRLSDTVLASTCSPPTPLSERSARHPVAVAGESVSARSGHEWDRESVTSALALWLVTVNMTKKLVKFLILFDNTNLLYFPGQFLTGRVLVELKDDTPALGESRSSTRPRPPTLDLRSGISQYSTLSYFEYLSIGLLQDTNR